MPLKLNGIVCKNALKGWCDQLSEHPKNYLFTLLLSLFFNYAVPLIVGAIVLTFFGNVYVGISYVELFSGVFPGISAVYLVHSTLGSVMMIITILVIDGLYLLYMWRQMGIYVLLPAVVEVVKWMIVLFFNSYAIIAIVLSLIPFMAIAVGAHFVSSKIEESGIAKQFIPILRD